MKIHPKPTSRERGLSLVEITLVIALMLTLAGIVTYSVSSMTDWREGRSASEKLKSVYIAQRSYLADHPTESTNDLTVSKIIPYLPGSPGSMPVQKSLNDDVLSIDVSTVPPVFELSDSTYDPSDENDDGLWDVGGL
ncbi:MAG: type II secretion system protein [Verrucomicrobiota bacterium]